MSDVQEQHEMQQNAAPVRAPASNRSKLEEFERDDDGRPPFILTWTEVKLLGIAGVSISFDRCKMQNPYHLIYLIGRLFLRW